MSWPLIGRSGEIRTINAALAVPGVSGVVIRGAQGVGKSRVVREVLAAAESAGHRSQLVVGSSSAQAIPLGALSGWATPGAADVTQLTRGVIDALTATPAGARLILGVDDAHLLDDLSAFVIYQIVQRGAAKVVFTVLDREPIPAAVHELWKTAFDHRELEPLTLGETADLLAAVLQAPVDRGSVARLWDLTRGNLLYLRTVVEQEVANDRLRLQRGRWWWVGEPVLPPTLVEIVESRVGLLPAPVITVVDLLAVGEPIDLNALRQIAEPEAIEDADSRGLITFEQVGEAIRVRVAHPLYGEVRRRRAPLTRMRRLRGLIASELATRDDRDDIHAVVRRAALSLDSDLPPDSALLTRAANGAVWLADLALAERLAHAADRAGGGAEAGFVRAHALSWLGRGEEAEVVLTGIGVDELSAGDRMRLAFLRASNMLWALADPASAKAIADAAAGTAPSAGDNYLDAFLTVYWFATDHPVDALQAAEHLDPDGLPAVAGAEVAWALSVIAGDAGRVTDAAALAEMGYAVAARSLDAPHMRFNIADAHVGALLLAGRSAEAVDVAARVRAEAAEMPGAAGLLGAAVAGRAALGAARLDTAVTLLEQAVEGLSITHAVGWGHRYQIPLVAALALRGHTCEAADLYATLEDNPRTFRQLGYERSLAQAWLVACEGAVSAAVAISLAAAERAATAGQFAAEVLCLQIATQLGDRSCGPRLKELQEVVEGPRVVLAARFAVALHSGDAAELTSVSTGFEEIGDIIAAVDAAAHAAVAYRKDERRGSALACSVRAATLAQQCGAAMTPALGRAAERLPLTARESEITALISRGLSNRAIADRLTLSVRTVESHIYRAMAKTGVADRDELSALVNRSRVD